MYSVKLSNISKYETDPTTVTNVMAIFLNNTHIDNISPVGVYRGDVVRREPRSRHDAHQEEKQAGHQTYPSFAQDGLYYIYFHIHVEWFTE